MNHENSTSHKDANCKFFYEVNDVRITSFGLSTELHKLQNERFKQRIEKVWIYYVLRRFKVSETKPKFDISKIVSDFVGDRKIDQR